MSKQVNFFAADEDASIFHAWLDTTFPDMTIVMSESSRHRAAGGVPQPIKLELLGCYPVYLVPHSCERRLTYFPEDSQVSLDIINSPAIEYSPSFVEKDVGCVKIGRLYWAYSGDVDRPLRGHIRSIFNWILSHSESIPGHGSWRIFPHARQFPLLRHWVGQPEPNPVFLA